MGNFSQRHLHFERKVPEWGARGQNPSGGIPIISQPGRDETWSGSSFEETPEGRQLKENRFSNNFRDYLSECINRIFKILLLFLLFYFLI